MFYKDTTFLLPMHAVYGELTGAKKQTSVTAVTTRHCFIIIILFMLISLHVQIVSVQFGSSYIKGL